MSKLYSMLFFTVLFFFSSSSFSQDSNQIKIMTLGDSRVEGARGRYESYRYDLWKLLVDNNVNFKFVGTKRDKGEYPKYKNLTFDFVHEGANGATVNDTLNNFEDTVDDGIKVDMVLLGIGMNNLLKGKSVKWTLYTLIKILKAIKDENAETAIFIELIAPARKDLMTSDKKRDFKQFRDILTELHVKNVKPKDKVYLIDMSKVLVHKDYADQLNYNAQGAKKIAQKYFEAINKHLILFNNKVK